MSELDRRTVEALSLLESLPDLLVLFDGRGTCIDHHGPSGEAYPMAPRHGRPLLEAFSPDLAALVSPVLAECVGEKRPAELDLQVSLRGSEQWFEFRAVPCGENLFMALMRNITDRRKERDALYEGAYHDPLTRLPNRAQFMTRLRRILERSQTHAAFTVALLMLDMDRFKSVNDSLGHLVGDQLLIEFGARLRRAVRPQDLVARLGGDEFVVLLDNIQSPAQALAVANRIHGALKKPFQLAGKELHCTTSIGLAVAAGGYRSADDMLRDADMAMYQAKSKGRGESALFEQSMHQRNLEQLSLENELRRGVQEQQFLLNYQTVHSLGDGGVSALEALVRWQHPRRGLLLPGEFIGLAEETGEIGPLGNWILERAMATAANFTKVLGRPISVSVNLSGRQLAEPAFADRVLAMLGKTGLPPSGILLEITERAVNLDPKGNARVLQQLHEAGVRVVLDNFGTGHSSLSYVLNLPLHYIKVDRGFVSRLPETRATRVVVDSVIRLAHELGIKVIAEGVEKAEERAVLTDLGCDLAQGYAYTRPSGEAEILDALRT
jgi:diguanylate cyclase (GGDEF)-like protein